MYRKALLGLLCCGLLVACKHGGQAKTRSLPRPDQVVRIMFYNVENLFDTEDDPHKLDNEFLPESDKHWTPDKYWEKQRHIAKVILNLGQWYTPALVGMAEIENRKVLEDMVGQQALRNLNYGIVHEESPDRRGIDVALIYRTDIFHPIHHHAYPVRFPFAPRSLTRDILYVKGTVGRDTLHVFVNHWPSRRGGAEASEPKRIRAAQVLRTIVDSLFRADYNPQIIIMGDFNDDPDNVSILDTLQTHTEVPVTGPEELFNPMYRMKKTGEGSLKYRGTWNLFDQLIISGSLLDDEGRIRTSDTLVHIYRAPWLLTEDTRYPGNIPFRTYAGLRYLGGFSDHLPVFIDLLIRQAG